MVKFNHSMYYSCKLRGEGRVKCICIQWICIGKGRRQKQSEATPKLDLNHWRYRLPLGDDPRKAHLGVYKAYHIRKRST